MSVWYNDNDPAVCAWLRELIRVGLLPDGEVDERSILDVQPDDLRGFTQCHFFAGVGGWPYALRLAGVPDDTNVWTGSPPCQPFSSAGLQKGIRDERHLAPKFAQLVRACRPGLLFGEQVASSLAFGKAAKRTRDAVESQPEWAWVDDLSDRLEAARYAIGASDIPVAGVGGYHIRQRTWFVAVPEEWLADTERGPAERHGHEVGEAPRGVQGAPREQRLRSDSGHVLDAVGMADVRGSGLQERERNGRVQREAVGALQGETSECGDNIGGMADADGGDTRAERQQRGGEHGLQPEDCGAVRGRGEGARDRRSGEDRLADHRPRTPEVDWSDPDWLFCRDGKWRPVEPGTFPLAHGVPARVVRLRGYGNAISPKAAAAFIKSSLEALDDLRLNQVSAMVPDEGIFG